MPAPIDRRRCPRPACLPGTSLARLRSQRAWKLPRPACGGNVRLTSFGPAVQTAAAEARPVPQLRMSSWLALLTAFAGGLALAAAFPPMAFWPLAVLGPALLAIALRGQRLRMALAAGLVFGLAFFYLLLSWEINLAWYV